MYSQPLHEEFALRQFDPGSSFSSGTSVFEKTSLKTLLDGSCALPEFKLIFIFRANLQELVFIDKS